MSNEEVSIIMNRMQTLLSLYDRGTTIDDLTEKTGLSYYQVRKVLSENNYFHGIKREMPINGRSVNPIIFFDKFEYLLACPKLDILRTV